MNLRRGDRGEICPWREEICSPDLGFLDGTRAEFLRFVAKQDDGLVWIEIKLEGTSPQKQGHIEIPVAMFKKSKKGAKKKD